MQSPGKWNSHHLFICIAHVLSCGHPPKESCGNTRPSNSVRCASPQKIKKKNEEKTERKKNNIANLITTRRKKGNIFRLFAYIFFSPCQLPLKLTHYVYVLDANRNGQRTFTHGWPKGQKSNLATPISWGSPCSNFIEPSIFIAHQVVLPGIVRLSPNTPLSILWACLLIAYIESIPYLHSNLTQS